MNKQQQINKRNEYIKTLQQFVFSSKELLQESLQKLNWTEEATIFKESDRSLSSCPLNQGHRVASSNLEKHAEMCRWHQQGYTDDCIPLPSSSSCSAASIVIDKKLQADIILQATANNPLLKMGVNIRERDVPQTSDRFFSDFTTDERRILYDYAVSRTAGAVAQIKEFSLPTQAEGKSEPLTREQLMAAERDAKRRRVRYRSVKVHTKSKNYSEVMREVINNQMSAYEDWLMDNCGVTGPSSSSTTEKKSTEETVSVKEDMIWLDWDFRSNPHVRWKNILEKEKRRIERKENDKKEDKVSDNLKKRREREANSFKKGHQRERSYRDEHQRNRYDRDFKEKDKEYKKCDSFKELYRSDRERSSSRVKEKSNTKERLEYSHISNKEDIFRHHLKSHKRSRSEYEKPSRSNERYRESNREFEHYNKDKKEILHSKSSRKYDKHHEIQETCVKIKKEFNDDYLHESDSGSEYHHIRKIKKFNESSSCKQEVNEKIGSSDSGDRSSKSSSTSHAKKVRRKKKKKKHKHKHNKKKHGKEPRSNRYTSSAESSDK